MINNILKDKIDFMLGMQYKALKLFEAKNDKSAIEFTEFKINSIEKQLPMKVKSLMRSNKSAAGYCPRCNNGVMIKNTFAIKHKMKKGHHCEWCGQTLDWGEDPFKENTFFSKLKEEIKYKYHNEPIDLLTNIMLIIDFILIMISLIIGII